MKRVIPWNLVTNECDKIGNAKRVNEALQDDLSGADPVPKDTDTSCCCARLGRRRTVCRPNLLPCNIVRLSERSAVAVKLVPFRRFKKVRHSSSHSPKVRSLRSACSLLGGMLAACASASIVRLCGVRPFSNVRRTDASSRPADFANPRSEKPCRSAASAIILSAGLVVSLAYSRKTVGCQAFFAPLGPFVARVKYIRISCGSSRCAISPIMTNKNL